MRLLIVTQKVDKNDEVLGFFHRWLEEFAKLSDEVTVLCLSAGDADLPKNVSIYTFGKKWRIFKIYKFWELFFRHYARADAVFFHMCPEFVLAASPFLISRKRSSALWYVHKSVTRNLKVAERLVKWIFTASELSFRLPSKKVIYTGHAIDTEAFNPTINSQPLTFNQQISSGGVKVLCIGRISPVKDLETVIRACGILKNSWQRSWSLSIVGGPAMERDKEYLESLKSLVSSLGLENFVHFSGPRSYTEAPEIYRDHDLFISTSTTGSMDKSVLEAMSSGLTVIIANEAFQSLLPEKYFLEKRSPEFLAERVKALADENRPNTFLRNLVIKNHSLEKTIDHIVKVLTPSF